MTHYLAKVAARGAAIGSTVSPLPVAPAVMPAAGVFISPGPVESLPRNPPIDERPTDVEATTPTEVDRGEAKPGPVERPPSMDAEGEVALQPPVPSADSLSAAVTGVLRPARESIVRAPWLPRKLPAKTNPGTTEDVRQEPAPQSLTRPTKAEAEIETVSAPPDEGVVSSPHVMLKSFALRPRKKPDAHSTSPSVEATEDSAPPNVLTSEPRVQPAEDAEAIPLMREAARRRYRADAAPTKQGSAHAQQARQKEARVTVGRVDVRVVNHPALPPAQPRQVEATPTLDLERRHLAWFGLRS